MSDPVVTANAPAGRTAPAETPAHVPTGDAPIRGEALLRRLEPLALRIEAAIAGSIPERLNPLARTGAIALALLLVATATGILLLPFYAASPGDAHASVAAMMTAPFTLGLLRSLHRYSSDGAVFFGVIHCVRLLLARRLGGPRAIPWATGAVMLALVILVGWLGYWLVWDDTGALIAWETARALDGLGLFGEPIERSFLTDSGLSATLFFVIFFAHVLLPLALAILLWLHVMKLPRVRLLPSRALTIALMVVLVAGSLLLPAPLGPAAAMSELPGSIRIDAWYALPLALTTRLGALEALALFTAATLLLAALPWLLAKRRPRVAEVHASSCNACSQCVSDCPYGAISLVPRGGLPGRAELVAEVEASRCVGCGLCSASCEPGGIGLPWMGSIAERNLVDEWVSEDVASGSPPVVAWICEEVASASLRMHGATGRVPGGPDLRVVLVPCAGFVHSLTIERALRRGARAVLLVSCPDGACRYREGASFLRARLLGQREPALRSEMIGDMRVRLVEAGAMDTARLLREADAAKSARGIELPKRPGHLRASLTAAALVLGFSPAFLLSDLRLTLPLAEHGELVVSFRQPGRIAELCRDLSPEEVAALPPHMRRTRECERARVPVTLRVLLDGEPVHESSHEGAGLWNDGESVALIRLTPGTRRSLVRVEIEDGTDSEGVAFADEREITFKRGSRRVILFDRNGGFSWQ